MDPLNPKPESQPKAQPRKFQYLSGGDSAHNNLTASSIDQHRNSIEQRIANLETKLAKKFHPQLELASLGNSLNENYSNTRRMYQYSGLNTENKNVAPYDSQSIHQNSHNYQNSSSVYPQPRQVTTGKGNTFKYLVDFDNNTEETVLKEKSKSNWQSNRNKYVSHHEKMQSKDKLKAVLDKTSDRQKFEKGQDQSNQEKGSSRMVGKKIQNGAQTKNQNSKYEHQSKYQSSEKFDRKYPLSHYHVEPSQFNIVKTTATVPQSNQIINGRYFEEYNQLSSGISHIKNSIGGSRPFESYQNPTALQSRTISYDSGINSRDQGKNNQLYEMMKNIMVGQERLEKQLIMLKNSKTQEHNQILQKDPKNHKNTSAIKTYKQRDQEKYIQSKQNKHVSVPDSKLMSPIPARQQKRHQLSQSHSQNPDNRKSVSPQTYKHPSPRPSKSPKTAKDPQTINQKRANSAVTGKKLPGKIQKNKERFDELYKQAQLNKRLNQSSCRFTVSSNVFSSVWDKIKQSIKRAESEDAQTSVIYHENNRWVNDHLVSKIELQKKLKNDLVKKVYDMVENKCFFK